MVFDEFAEFEEETDVEFEVVFPELEEPKRAVIGIPSVASEIADAIAPFSYVLFPDNSGLVDVLSSPFQQ